MSTVYVSFRIMTSDSKRAKNCCLYLNDFCISVLLHCNTVNGLFGRTIGPHLVNHHDLTISFQQTKNLCIESGHAFSFLVYTPTLYFINAHSYTATHVECKYLLELLHTISLLNKTVFCRKNHTHFIDICTAPA